ncbi:MAG: hypothetical protein GY898_06655 [Proteobacteria bacterium]|nr:hypothetical protein [Pseudomonadota bacterium]
MRAETHLWMFRCLLLMVLVVPALNCTEEGGGGCDCDCLDVPEDDDDSTDDDDSAVGSDDDDSTDDDDSSADDDDDVVDVTGDLPACEGSVLAAFTEDEIQPPGPASDGYLIPSEDTIEAVVASVEALTSGNAALALAEVAVVGYELCGGAGDEAGTALWRPVEPGSGRAVIAWRAVEARPLIVGVPHPWFEDGTLDEGVYAFGELDARVLISAGAHRCANTGASPCDGTTGVCGGDDLPYRESDQAHVTETVFGVGHELFADLFEDDVVVSLHGMADEGVSLSDGTDGDVASDSVVATLAAALATEFPEQLVTTCNDYDGALVADRLCGTTNAQGRYVNGSESPCDTAADAAGGRFVHLEQSSTMREDGETVMELLIEAVD